MTLYHCRLINFTNTIHRPLIACLRLTILDCVNVCLRGGTRHEMP